MRNARSYLQAFDNHSAEEKNNTPIIPSRPANWKGSALLAEGVWPNPAGPCRRRLPARPCRSRRPSGSRSSAKKLNRLGPSQLRSSLDGDCGRKRRRKTVGASRIGRCADENGRLPPQACGRARPNRRPADRDASRGGSYSRFRQRAAGRLDPVGLHHVHRRRSHRNEPWHRPLHPGGRELPPFDPRCRRGCHTIHVRPRFRFPRVPFDRPHRWQQLRARFRESGFAKLPDPNGQVRNHLWRPGERRRADRRGQSELDRFFWHPPAAPDNRRQSAEDAHLELQHRRQYGRSLPGPRRLGELPDRHSCKHPRRPRHRRRERRHNQHPQRTHERGGSHHRANQHESTRAPARKLDAVPKHRRLRNLYPEQRDLGEHCGSERTVRGKQRTVPELQHDRRHLERRDADRRHRLPCRRTCTRRPSDESERPWHDSPDRHRHAGESAILHHLRRQSHV